MRKAIYGVFKDYNDLVIRSDRKGNPFTLERQLDEMETAMDGFIYGKGC